MSVIRETPTRLAATAVVSSSSSASLSVTTVTVSDKKGDLSLLIDISDLSELVILGDLCDPVLVSTTRTWSEFAAVPGTMPDTVERLSEIHRPTADGQWCRGCTRPGGGAPHIRWPCSIAALLAHASRPN
jgi:hypothetical protein